MGASTAQAMRALVERDVDLARDVCRLLKKSPATSHIPVLMLTSRAEEVDRIVGPKLGADDYVVKPFSPRKLVLRIRAILRRGQGGGGRGQKVDCRGGLRYRHRYTR